MKLPSKIKKRWLKALRSGEYTQGRRALYNPKEASFCCLGVLQHVCLGGAVEYLVVDKNKRYRAVPTQEFYDYIGAGSGSLCSEEESELIAMNDNRVPFSVIADYIEKNVGTTDA